MTNKQTPPFGYSLVTMNGKQVIVPHPIKHAVVKDMFKKYTKS